MDTAKETFRPEMVPQWYINKLKIEILHEMVKDGANDASVKLDSQIREAEKRDPVLHFVAKIYVETWLLTNGYCMIPDASRNASIRQEMEAQRKRGKKTGFLVRLGDAISGHTEKTRTEIIEQTDALMLLNETLKTENQELEILNSEERARAADTHSKSIVESKEMLSNTAQECGKMLLSTKAEQAKLQEEADEKLEKARLKLQNMEREIETKEVIRKELDSNLGVQQVYQKLHADSETVIRLEITNCIQSLGSMVKSRNKDHSYPDTNRSVLGRALRLFRSHILENLLKVENTYGTEKMNLMVPGVVMELEREAGDSYFWVSKSSTFRVSFFTEYLARLKRPNMTITSLIKLINDTYGPLMQSSSSVSDEQMDKMLGTKIENWWA